MSDSSRSWATRPCGARRSRSPCSDPQLRQHVARDALGHARLDRAMERASWPGRTCAGPRGAPVRAVTALIPVAATAGVPALTRGTVLPGEAGPSRSSPSGWLAIPPTDDRRDGHANPDADQGDHQCLTRADLPILPRGREPRSSRGRESLRSRLSHGRSSRRPRRRVQGDRRCSPHASREFRSSRGREPRASHGRESLRSRLSHGRSSRRPRESGQGDHGGLTRTEILANGYAHGRSSRRPRDPGRSPWATTGSDLSGHPSSCPLRARPEPPVAAALGPGVAVLTRRGSLWPREVIGTRSPALLIAGRRTEVRPRQSLGVPRRWPLRLLSPWPPVGPCCCCPGRAMPVFVRDL